MIKVLHIYPKMSNAGTEKVIMNLYKNINKNNVQFDFLVKESGELDKQIEALGGKVYKLNGNGRREYYLKLIDFFKKNKYEIIHVHIQGDMELILKAAKKSGIVCRIIHSHNSRQDLPRFLKIFKIIRNIKIKNNATDFLACSNEAAKWLFPFNYKEAKIVYNAVEIEKFIFNEEIRIKIRQQLNIMQNEKIIIYVARFARQKNHKRFVEIMKKVYKRDHSIKVLFVGDGPLEEKIKDIVRSEGIEDKFIFLGNKKNVNELLMAADLFLFPSLHEGLGIVAVESQFSGLMCVASDRIPEEADIGVGLLTRVKLKQNNEYWSNIVIESLNNEIDRKNIIKNNIFYNYDIKNIAKDMEKFYISRVL